MLFRSDGSFEKDKGEVIGGNTGEQIQIYMKKQAQRFSSIKGALISTIREGEVLKVSIPTNYIFQPNDTNFVEQADLRLRPILVFMRKNLTTLIVTSHTDNTGSEQFLQKSCFERACRIEDWFLSNGVKVENMSVYSMVDTQPLYDNDSMENRSKNRRITFYLVPNKEMIKLAKKNKLN